jgi:hypothetical protein
MPRIAQPQVLSPTSAQTTVTSFCATAREAALHYGTRDLVVLRTVSVISSRDRLIPLAALLRIGEQPPGPEPALAQFEAGGLYFAHAECTTSDLTDTPAFIRCLTRWLPEGVCIDAHPVQETFWVHRYESHDRRLGLVPCWSGDVHRALPTT